MSRVGKYPITLKSGLVATSQNGIVSVKGTKGELSLEIPNAIDVKCEDNLVSVVPKDNNLTTRKLWGTIRARINNMVIGVSEGFTVELAISGVGYRASIQGKNLVLQLGFTNDVIYNIPSDVSILCPEPTRIILSGIDKQRVTQAAAEIRKYKQPEPYKGKGIRYSNETVLRKEGKKK